MTKEQKEAIEELEEFIKGPCETCKYCESAYKLNRKNIIQSLNLNKKLQKENEILKEEKEQDWEEWNNLEQGSYEIEQKLKKQIKELQKENEELKEDLKYVLNQTLGAFGKN